MQTYAAPAWMGTAALSPRWGLGPGSPVSTGRCEGSRDEDLPSGAASGSPRPCGVVAWVGEGSMRTTACSLDVSLGRAVQHF